MTCVREVHPSTARVGLIQSVNEKINTVRVLVRWARRPLGLDSIWTHNSNAYLLAGEVDGVLPGAPSLGSFGRADPCSGVLPIEESNLFLAASNLFPDSAAKECPPLWEVAGLATAGEGRVVVEVVGVTLE